MITPILLAVAALVSGLALVITRRPDKFRIARSILMHAAPEAAFAQVNDLHRWQEMSPYAKYDPAADYAFSGPRRGPGATLAWTGNNKVGEGRMTIVASSPHDLVRMNLEFFKPFKVNNTAEFTFETVGADTKVTWSMFGTSRFLCKAMRLFFNMDKMCGSQFEEGLANMKKIAEAQIQPLQPVG